MTNEELVLERIKNNPFLGSNPIHFNAPRRENSCCDNCFRDELDRYNNVYVASFKNARTVEERILNIIIFGQATYHENGKFQCRAGARRSTLDLWRIYKYYFPEENADVFTIMRALYKLVSDGKLNTYRCPDVRKRVYWLPTWDYTRDFYVSAELGVPLSEWKDIGLNNVVTKVT